ncbi:hypothetical protein LCGC14_0249420 [marine sediment metagenome]|uniref:Uncharacterized protein n=1 Tax=marine sediment metagenome TaxID=412755 RepID=A0A0F9U9S9_9ZZZZ
MTDDPIIGGYGQSLKDVKHFTLDQVYMILVERKHLKEHDDGVRTKSVASSDVATKVDADGMVAARAEDGTRLRLKTEGKSLARRLMEEEQHKKERRARKKRRGRKRRLEV